MLFYPSFLYLLWVISIYNAEDMIYNSDTDTSFLEFQSRVRDTFLRYATKWKFVIIDAK